nr:unnamed protein product [Digitaria exilis]
MCEPQNLMKVLTPGTLCSWPESGRHVVGVRRRPRQAGRATAAGVGACCAITSRATARCCLAPRSAMMASELGHWSTVPRLDSLPLRSKRPLLRISLAQPRCALCPSSGGASMARNSVLSSVPKHSTEHPHSFPQLAPSHFPSPRVRSHLLQPPAARTELESRAKFVLIPRPSPNSSRTELDHFPSFHFPHFSRAFPNSPARNWIFPQILISGRRSTSTSSAHFEPSPRSTEHSNSFTESHWCSRAPLTPPRQPHRHRTSPTTSEPPNRHHSTRGELLVLFPHFSDLLPPSFGRCNTVDEPRT